ncbi:MAG: aldehyde dehydrogenase family protein, partial [Simkaniaceae bacterium]|nr:aldehyde dehydrogenase family protein [Simkaniaceae bacterium]
MTDFLTSVNPATEEQLAKYPVLSRDEVNQKVALAHAAWLEWRKTDFAFRAKKIRKAAR